MGNIDIFIVLNPVAGHSKIEAIRQVLQERFGNGGKVVEVYETTGNEDLPAMTKAAIERGAQLVIAGGGDGTISGVVDGLVNSRIPLGVIPVGTGNALARALNIPLDMEDAVALIAGEHDTVRIDAMRVGKQYFTSNVSAGLSAQSMRRTPHEQKQRFGVLAYIWNIVTGILNLEPRRFDLEIDGHCVRVRAGEILVSNGKLLVPPLTLGPSTEFNDGTFDIYIITARTLADYLNILWNMIFHPGSRKSDLRHITANESVRIEALRRPQPVQADGEIIGRTPVEIQLVRNALQVIVPIKK